MFFPRTRKLLSYLVKRLSFLFVSSARLRAFLGKKTMAQYAAKGKIVLSATLFSIMKKYSMQSVQ